MAVAVAPCWFSLQSNSEWCGICRVHWWEANIMWMVNSSRDSRTKEKGKTFKMQCML